MNLPCLACSAFALLLAAGCGAAVDPTPTPSGGTTGGGTGTNGTGTSTAPTVTNPTTDADSCTEIHNQAQTDLTPAYTAAATGCTVDDDCEHVSDGNDCDGGCYAIVSRSGAPTLASALAAQDTGICAQYLADGCMTSAHGCFAEPGYQTPQCIASACVPGISAAWTSFSLQVDTSAFGTAEPTALLRTAITPCSEAGCTTWTVNSIGQVETVTESGTTSAVLSPTDLTTLDQALRDPTFRQVVLAQESLYPASTPLYPCPPAGSTPGTPAEHAVASIARADESASLSGDVSDCLESYAASNVFGPLYTLLQKY